MGDVHKIDDLEDSAKRVLESTLKEIDYIRGVVIGVVMRDGEPIIRVSNGMRLPDFAVLKCSMDVTMVEAMGVEPTTVGDEAS